MKVSDLQVLLDDIVREGLSLTLDLDSPEVLTLIEVEGQKSPPLASPLTGIFELTENEGWLRIAGNFKVAVTTECDRCLTPFTFELTAKVNELFQLNGPGLALKNNMALESDDDQASEVTLAVKNGRIDLSPLLAELFWLEWPFRHLCQFSCGGICPHCGQNRNLGSCSCPK